MADESGVGDDVPIEGQNRRETLDLELVECAAGTLECLLAVLTGDDQFGEHRIELPADDVALLHAGVDAHAGARGLLVDGDRAGRGEEVSAGVFAVDPELDRVSARCGVFGELELLAVGDAELLADEVDARRLLGDGVLDLQTGVDLEEGDQAVVADEEFDGARTVVTGLAADGLGRRVDAVALFVGEERCGCLLDELLEATLQRAVAGTGDDHVAVLIGDDLRLDVACLVEVALDEALAATERGDGLTGGRLEQLGDLLDGVGHLHAAATAAERRLDRDRHAVLLGERDDLVGVADRVLGARSHRGVGLQCDVARGDLVAEVADRLR